MKSSPIWRCMTSLMLVMLVVPAVALGQELHPTLMLEGTTTAIVQEQRIAAARQREQIVIAGAGFASRELIDLWMTAPDGSVRAIDSDELKARADGSFRYEMRLSAILATGLHHFTAHGRRSGQAVTEPLMLLPGEGPTPTPGTSLTVTPATARQLDTVELSAVGFAAKEEVALWITQPDGSVIGLGRTRTDDSGAFGGSLFLPGSLPIGRHHFTARGISSGHVAITAFVLEYGNGLEVDGARLAADLGRIPQRSRVELNVAGENFMPNEPISFWLTQPNGAVLSLGTMKADGKGNLKHTVYLGESLPLGTHYLSFRSNRSNQAGFVKLFLTSGAGN